MNLVLFDYRQRNHCDAAPLPFVSIW